MSLHAHFNLAEWPAELFNAFEDSPTGDLAHELTMIVHYRSSAAFVIEHRPGNTDDVRMSIDAFDL